MSKIFVIDTNVLLHDPKSLFSFEDNEVVIPFVVLDELDKKKTGADEVARHARMVIRSLDNMRSLGNINSGVKTERGGIIRVELGFKEKCTGDLDPSRPDNRIIGVALGLMEKDIRRVTVVSKDINLRVKCDALNVISEDYSADAVADNAGSIYSGTTEIEADDLFIDMFCKDGSIEADGLGALYPNQYVCLRSATTAKKSALARFENGSLVKIKTFNNIWGISSKNKEQAFALDALFNPEIKLVTLIGNAGTGKTILAAASAVSQVFDGHAYKRIILSRPVQEFGKQALGFTPGDINEKMAPWMAPLNDNLELLFSDKGSNFLDMQREGGVIQVEALNYIRGRSLQNTLFVLDESQNLNSHEIKTIITRMGENSKIVLTGDIMQIDNVYLDSTDNGLSYLVEKFKHHDIAAHVTLKRGERSTLATLASEIL